MPEGYRKFRLKTLISGIMLAVQNTQGKLSSEKGTMILTEWLDEKLARSLLYIDPTVSNSISVWD